MATTKRERQKAARRKKMEAMQKRAKRRQNMRRGIIVGIVAVVVLGTGALLFSSKSTADDHDDHGGAHDDHDRGRRGSPSASTHGRCLDPVARRCVGQGADARRADRAPAPPSLELGRPSPARARRRERRQVHRGVRTRHYSRARSLQSSWSTSAFSAPSNRAD